jgi:hypothetical protein
MPSAAVVSLRAAVQEVAILQAANPSPTGSAPQKPDLTRVIGRACVVLLSSHFERYIYAVNEEAVDRIRNSGAHSSMIPLDIRLQHSRQPIDELGATEWVQRRQGLEALSTTEAPLWIVNGISSKLQSDRLLTWMRSPKCREIVRYYRLWGITDIFTAVTRKPHTRSDLWLQLTSLVDKRNSIAHGDATTEATQEDIRTYRRSVVTFCSSADTVLSRRLARLFGFPRPW